MTTGLSKNAHLTRQLDLIPLEVLDTPINIIGAGAIGSFTALSLAKMGFSDITVFDDDTIDIENMNCQFFRFDDIGSPKVLALQGLIEDFTKQKINAVNDRWSGKALDGIVICAVDNMETRKAIFEAHFKKGFNAKLILDGRMGAEIALLFGYNPLSPSEGENYEKSLYTDEEAVPERCTSKSTIYSSLGISSFLCSAVKQYVTTKRTNFNNTLDLMHLEAY